MLVSPRILARYAAVLKHHGAEADSEFDELFVDSEAYQALHAQLLSARVFCVTGPEGGGKSTALRRVSKELQKGGSVVYVDFKGAPKNTGIESIAQTIRSRLLSRVEAEFGVNIPAIVAGLYELGFVDELNGLAASTGLDRKAFSADLGNGKIRLSEERWEKLTSAVQPGHLMAYVGKRQAERGEQRRIWWLIIDNVDDMPNGTQCDITELADRIASQARERGQSSQGYGLLRIAIGIRRRNVEFTTGRLPSDKNDKAETLTFRTPRVYCEKCQAQTLEAGALTCSCGHAIPSAIISLLNHLAKKETAESYKPFILKRYEVFKKHESSGLAWPDRRKVGEERATDRDFQNIDWLNVLTFIVFDAEEYHHMANGSARLLLRSSASFMEYVNTNQVYRASELVKLQKQGKFSEVLTQLRSLLYRWIATKHHEIGIHRLAPEVVFPSSGCSLHVLILFRLIRAGQHVDGEYRWMSIESLYDSLGEIGYKPAQINKALWDLFRDEDKNQLGHLVDLRLKSNESDARLGPRPILGTDAASVTSRGAQFARRAFYKFHYLQAFRVPNPEGSWDDAEAAKMVGEWMAQVANGHVKSFRKMFVASEKHGWPREPAEFLQHYRNELSLRTSEGEQPLQIARMSYNARSYLGATTGAFSEDPPRVKPGSLRNAEMVLAFWRLERDFLAAVDAVLRGQQPTRIVFKESTQEAERP